MPSATNAVTELLAKLQRHIPDPYTMGAFELLRSRLHLLPMRWVLRKIEGDNVGERARRIGISRSTWYAWERGEFRPNHLQAERISQLTGIPPERFQGRRCA